MRATFWTGFEKRGAAESSGDGGSGHTGAGKLNLGTAPERAQVGGTESALGSADGQDTRADMTMLDRSRGARTEDPFGLGPEFQDETNPHIRY